VTSSFLELNFLDNQVYDYLLSLAVLIIGFLTINLLKSVAIHRLKRWATKTDHELDERLIRLVKPSIIAVLYLGTFYIAIGKLALHPILQQLIDFLGVIVATIISILLFSSLVEYAARLYQVRHDRNLAIEQTLNAVIPAVKISIWAIGLIFLLDNLGFDVSAVAASLGIGGIAVALAAQGVLGDLFSYVTILLDRPFELGDFIKVGEMVGVIEHIGIKTTRVRSLSGEQLIFANTDITSSRINNFKRMERRRVVFQLGITYETPSEKMKAIPDLIQHIIEQTNNTTFDRAHFFSYGDFSLNYEVVYYIESSDYGIYMDAQQGINLAIKEAFESREIEFAYPTQVNYLNVIADGNNVTLKPAPSEEILA
jgi:small-conductance mechanosensitive channel